MRRTKSSVECGGMNVPPTATSETVGSASRGDLRQHSGLLLLTRMTCIVVDTLALALFVVTLPTYFAHLHTTCPAASCSFGQLSASATHSLSVFGLSLHTYAVLVVTFVVIATFLCVALAALLLFRRSDTWMALLAAVLLVFLATSDSTADTSVLRPWLGSALAVPVAGISNYLGAIALPLLFSLFPSGRFVPGFLRWLVLAQLIIGVIFILPFSPPALVLILSNFFWISCLLCLVGAQIYRYRRVSTSVERQQTKWVIFGLLLTGLLAFGLLLPALLFPLLRQPDSPYFTLWTLIATFILTLSTVVSLSLAILRYRLWDIDLIIKRTLVYGILTACVVGFYVLVVGYLGAIFHTGSNLLISLLATGLVAVLFQPLRELLQRAVNRLLFGQRDEPYSVISQLGQRLEVTLAPDAVLAVIVETIAQALKLPYAAVALKQDEEFPIAASYVSPKGRGDAVLHSPDTFLHLPLLYQSEPVGELVLAPRTRGESLTPADQRLLADLARQVGIAAHAVRLTADLQQSRERLVTAREEERRRLRRDLHDGLGPALASMTLKLDAARNLLTRDPAAADALLIDLKKQTQASLTDIRRLVYALRPPSLDELGLVQALREQAEQYLQDGLRITLDAPEPLPPLPAAVEVATYRIVQEAMTNVVRHAQARTCIIRLALNLGLDIEVCDDGRGIPTGQRAGVGLTSIRERVAELAGICEIEARPSGGTRLHVQLPLPKATEREE
ncbi:GAF domain-containing sensor histidine kinase [Ktedonobacter racemifer]|nr:GAF domain-containing sensor histidine kinase [Ktedonobacter racemifer]